MDIIERDRILVIVKNNLTNLFLTVKYVTDWETAFLSGWVEEWETREDSIKKELFEESWITDFQDLIHLENLDFEISLFHPQRKQNYKNKTYVYFATIQKDFDIDSMSEEEINIQIPNWDSLDEIEQIIIENTTSSYYEPFKYLLDEIKKLEI